MTQFGLIISNFKFYFKANLLVALGIAISTAVLTGSMIIGDSVRYSLEKSTFYRLGNTTHSISAVDRYFRTELSGEMSQKGNFTVAPTLILEGMAMTEGGKFRVNKIQITGINNQFEKISNSSLFHDLSGNEIIISENLAERLQLKVGDYLLVRIRKASLIPLNAPLVSGEETSISFRAVIKAIADKENMGFFNLKNSQSVPYNLFLSLTKLNALMHFQGKSNNLLISAPGTDQLYVNQILNNSFTPEDAGLNVKDIVITGEKEINSERVFIDDQIFNVFKSFPGANPVMTYFANSIEYNGSITPYSFISTINDDDLKSDEIIINEWVASDLKLNVGDSLIVSYFEIGSLRQLTEKKVGFIVKKIVPISGRFGDRDLMPLLPGMSDAVNCREWDTGVPIKLENIRDKDEAYWKMYKGTPKGFISLNRAKELWSNRFGSYTAIRITQCSYSEARYRQLFAASLKPINIGIITTNVRDVGISAAKNGVDFSQLFIGLSFFILVASVMLTSLLFRLNLENRQSQIGTLLMVGFTRKQIRKMFLTEGLIIALAGGILGLFLAFLYSKIVFIALNTLWWDVVRTSVLSILILPVTLNSGLIISVLISEITIYVAIGKSFRRHTSELQRQQVKPQNRKLIFGKKIVAFSCLTVVAILTGIQLYNFDHVNTGLFFLLGGLLLLGTLLLTDLYFRKNEFTKNGLFSRKDLIHRNISGNPGRSLTIIILFALGTFLVISTGSNKMDLFIDASDKSGGAGGFELFAESSVPILYNLNDELKRKKEGLPTNFSVAQFSKIDGDDASCLNLNHVSNPTILGADTEFLKDRFSFTEICDQLKDKNIWKELEKTPIGNVIPAIADQTVIQWGLGKSLGDTLTYRNEKGDTLKLKLIAGLSPSVFQGYVLISNSNFLKNYPTNSGSNLFLIEVPHDQMNITPGELESALRDYGWEMTSTKGRLMNFSSVTNTYLSIFLALGALGLILGTIGLAIVLARTILERRNEITILLSIGFSKYYLIKIFIAEYTQLLAFGIAIGFLSAILAVLPVFLYSGNSGSFITVLLIVLGILLNGLFWIFSLSYSGIQKKISLAPNL